MILWSQPFSSCSSIPHGKTTTFQKNLYKILQISAFDSNSNSTLSERFSLIIDRSPLLWRSYLDCFLFQQITVLIWDFCLIFHLACVLFIFRIDLGTDLCFYWIFYFILHCLHFADPGADLLNIFSLVLFVFGTYVCVNFFVCWMFYFTFVLFIFWTDMGTD